jgi:hypothetical protein
MAEWDIPNWITLIVEVAVAIFAVVISWKFYNKGKKQQEKIQEIETEQSNLIKEMKPIIEKQGKIIEEQEEKERIVIANLKGNISFYLRNIRDRLLVIDNLIEKETSPIRIAFDHEYIIPSVVTSTNQISKTTQELFSLEVEIPREVSNAQEKINLYLPKLKHALNEEKGSLEIPPDPTEVIRQIDIALKKLPEPGSA